MKKELSKYAMLPLRLVLGAIFMYHGYGKLFGSIGVDGFSGMLGSLGVPLPMVFAVLVALIELVGGLAVFVGFKTEIFAFLIGVVMVFAIALVKIKQGWGGIEFELALLAMAATLVLEGPGSKFVVKR